MYIVPRSSQSINVTLHRLLQQTLKLLRPKIEGEHFINSYLLVKQCVCPIREVIRGRFCIFSLKYPLFSFFFVKATSGMDEKHQKSRTEISKKVSLFLILQSRRNFFFIPVGSEFGFFCVRKRGYHFIYEILPRSNPT